MCHRLRYATFAGLGGADASDSGPGKPDVDSIDFWPVLSGSSSRAVPPRTEVVIGFNFTHSHPLQGALIVGTHKLIVNQQGYNSNDSLSWTPVDFPCSSVLGGTDCNPYCVFDVYDDPAERTDLSGNVTLLAGLLARYTALGKEPVNWHDRAGSKPGGRPPDDDYAETCALMTKEGGFWRPWRNSTTPPPPPRPPGPGGGCAAAAPGYTCEPGFCANTKQPVSPAGAAASLLPGNDAYGDLDAMCRPSLEPDPAKHGCPQQDWGCAIAAALVACGARSGCSDFALAPAAWGLIKLYAANATAVENGDWSLWRRNP